MSASLRDSRHALRRGALISALILLTTFALAQCSASTSDPDSSSKLETTSSSATPSRSTDARHSRTTDSSGAATIAPPADPSGAFARAAGLCSIFTDAELVAAAKRTGYPGGLGGPILGDQPRKFGYEVRYGTDEIGCDAIVADIIPFVTWAVFSSGSTPLEHGTPLSGLGDEARVTETEPKGVFPSESTRIDVVRGAQTFTLEVTTPKRYANRLPAATTLMKRLLSRVTESTESGTQGDSLESAGPDVCGNVVNNSIDETVRVTVASGSTPCSDARLLVDTYYNDPPEAAQGSLGFVQIGDWGCASATSADATTTGHLGDCTSDNGSISLDRP